MTIRDVNLDGDEALIAELVEAIERLLLTKRICKINPGNEEIHMAMCSECQARAALAKAKERSL